VIVTQGVCHIAIIGGFDVLVVRKPVQK